MLVLGGRGNNEKTPFCRLCVIDCHGRLAKIDDTNRIDVVPRLRFASIVCDRRLSNGRFTAHYGLFVEHYGRFTQSPTQTLTLTLTLTQTPTLTQAQTLTLTLTQTQT